MITDEQLSAVVVTAKVSRYDGQLPHLVANTSEQLEVEHLTP